jgi:outer membrane receptor for ferrienterochelin and colicins
MANIDASLSDQLDFWGKGELSKFDRGGDSTSVENTYRLSAGATWKPSADHAVNLKGYHYEDDFDAESSASRRYGNINYDQIEVQYTTSLTANQLVTAGAEFQRQTIDYLIDNSGSNRTTVVEDVDTISMYLQDEATLFEDLVVVPGIRYDNHSTFGDSFNPKLSLMYRMLDATTLRASVGKAFKSPTIRQLYYDVPFYHSPFYIQSNPDLEPEKSIGYSLGIEQWLSGGNIVLTAGYFRNDVTDMVVSEVSDETYNGADLYVYRNVEEAMTQGLECSARMQLGSDVLLQAAYTYSDTENKENGKALTLVPEHEFSLTPSYVYAPIGVGISATLSWLSKQYTDTDNTAELDSYMVVDAKVYKTLGSTAKLTFEADNVFDSDKGDKTYYFYRTGQTFTLKLDFAF